MKRNTLLFAVLLSVGTANAQDKLPSFGQIDKADLTMKDCDFDPGAEAVKLIDIGEMSYAFIEGSGWESEISYRIRIKVLKASAIHLSEIKMGYYSKDHYQDITNISGVSFNLDESGNITESKLEKKSTFFKPIDKERTEVSFALPDVKTGTVFEYKYKMTRRSYSYIPTWTFQEEIPVRYSAYKLTIPEYFQFTTQVTKRQDMEKKDDDKSTWYIMRKIAGLKDEPFSSGKEDYLQRVEFQLSKIDAPNFYKEVRTTWPKIITELVENEYFGEAIKKNLKGTADLDAQLTTAATTREKIRVVYKYVQANMQWNKDYGIYSDNGIKDAWDKKNGSIADINFILIRLLRDAGISAKPLLASTKDNGVINTIYPFLGQFNCVLTYVADGENIYVMNAADKYNAFDLVPYDVLYTNALVVDKEVGGIIAITSNRKYSNNIFFSVQVDDNGKISGDATLNSEGYARNIRESTYRRSQLKEMLEDNEGINVKVDSLDINNEKDELMPFEQKVKFGGTLESSGEYLFLPYSMFTGLGKNPFTAEERVMDIDFDYPKNYVITGTYMVPENYVISELPKNTKMILPDTSIVLTRLTQNDGNIVSLRLSLNFKGAGYAAESYPYIKEFFKKLYDILDERIVIKKK